MTLSKIQLSLAETELICNAELILTKNKALEKIRLLLEQSQHMMQEHVLEHGLQEQELFRNPPKISRGELYRGLPWIILDYPRVFSRDCIFAVRSLFWWGHFFSSTLHISHDASSTEHLASAYPFLQQHYIGVNTDPWQHHFEKDNYEAIKVIAEKNWPEQIRAKEHIKIARAWPLQDWNLIPVLLFENWKKMLELVNYRGGEKGPSPG